MNTTQAEQSAVEEVEFGNAITFLNMTGDITVTWDARHDDKIKELVRKQMAQGVTFFTMRKVIIDAIQVKRKVGAKGVDSITSLVLEDEQFANLVDGIDDKELAELLRSGTGQLAKRRGKAKQYETLARAKDAEEVMKAKQAVAVRKVVGG